MSDPEIWRYNYFNYFTEVEEHFQKARGTGLFLLSPLDWMLVETWKNSGVPLEAVLRGIDEAFEKWHSRKKKTQMVNSIAYCAQAILTNAQAMAEQVDSHGAVTAEDAPFPIEDIRAHLERAVAALGKHSVEAMQAMRKPLEEILGDLETHFRDLQSLDQRLTAIEEKISALLRTQASEEQLFRNRQALDRQLSPYRGKLTADQLARLETTYLDRMMLEQAGLPRLSLFYL